MAWNVLMQPPLADHGLRDSLNGMGCSYNVQDMRPNPLHQVWHGPQVDDDGDVIPAIVGDSSDDELWQAVDRTANEPADPVVDTVQFDTDDELGYDDWYDAPRGTCRGEAEHVLGSERPFNPVD